MRLARIFVVSCCVLALASSAFAGDLASSVAKAAKEQAQAAPATGAGNRNTLVWPGTALVAAGLGMTLWGLLHTSDGKYATPIDMSKTSKPQLVGAGMAVVAGGGALMFWGSQRARSASVAIGPRGVTVSKQVSW